MALMLMLLPWARLVLQDHAGLGEKDGSPITAPPQLTALIPAAAKATVDAGYTNSNSGVSAAATTAQTVASEIPVMAGATVGAVNGSSKPSSPNKAGVMIVGDTHYDWQDWSKWHCNCQEGSMSRVRDITYSAPGGHLDPIQFNVLRFQRVVCSYAECNCSRKAHECDKLEVTCNENEKHMCALKDIQQDQSHKKHDFWAHVLAGLKELWHTIQESFSSEHKVGMKWEDKRVLMPDWQEHGCATSMCSTPQMPK